MSKRTTAQRVPPHSQEAELAVLGAVLLEPKAMAAVATRLTPAEFYRAEHQRLFGAFLALWKADQPIDVVTVREELKRQGDEDLAGNADMFMQLGGQMPSVTNAEHYAEIVHGMAQLRGLIQASAESATEAYDAGAADAQDVMDGAMQRLLALQQTRLSGKPAAASDTIKAVVTGLLAGDNSRQWGTRYGWPELDDMTLGMHDGEMVVVAGAPSSGKTTLALNVVHHLLLGGGLAGDDGVLFFSLEMNREQLCQNLLVRAAEVNNSQLRSGQLDKPEWVRVRTAANAIYKAPLYIDDTPGQSVTALRAKARAHCAEYPVKLVVVDYLQLATADVNKGATKETEVEAISHGMKNLARELKRPVLVLSQLNRSGDGGRPTLSRLRGSGAIEQDADVVLFLHSGDDDLAGDYNYDDGLDVQLIVGKQRNGPRGTLPLKFYAHQFRFTERPAYQAPADEDQEQ